MRRKIELYIGGELADISEQSFILYNYAFSDLENPTALRDSWSQKVTLPGTPANDAIFGHYYRADRTNTGGSGIGINYNALAKTEFVIYEDTGEILQSGYLKLEGIGRKDAGHTYEVTLYGGFGAFLYGLMYDANGEKRQLYDMQYYVGATAVSAERTITKEMINEAWTNIDNYSPDASVAKHRLLNYIPCYNGIPADFAADTIAVYNLNRPAGMPAYLEDKDGNQYQPYNGFALVKLTQAINEWQASDLRSYLQRPCLNIQAFLDSVSKPENNGGWNITWHTRPRREQDLWLTLRRPDTLVAASTENIDLNYPLGSFHNIKVVSGNLAGRGSKADYKTININAGEADDVSVTLKLKPWLRHSVQLESEHIYLGYDKYSDGGDTFVSEINGGLVAQLVAYDSSNAMVGYSKVLIVTSFPPRNDGNVPRTVYSSCNPGKTWNQFTLTGYTYNNYSSDNVAICPVYSSRGAFIYNGTNDGHGYMYPWEMMNYVPSLKVEGRGIKKVVIKTGFVTNSARTSSNVMGAWSDYNMLNNGGGEAAGINPEYGFEIEGSASVSKAATRSGATIAQEQMLASDHSIADYLLSLAKIYGWVFTTDAASKTIEVWSRNGFYDDTLAKIDLTERIDRSKDYPLAPLYATSKIYRYALEVIPSAVAAKYESDFGRKYGDKVINTGYEFNAKAEELTKSLVFRQGCVASERSALYCNMAKGNYSYRGWEQLQRTLIYGGVSGASYSEEAAPVTDAVRTSFSNSLADSDWCGRFQFCDADGKAVDGHDVLVYMTPRSGWGANANNGDVYITDDVVDVLDLNSGKPCWMYAATKSVSKLRSSIPQFSFQRTDGDELEWGLPAAVYDPYATGFSDDECWYAKYWRAYMTDRLDQDTKVLRCRVDLRGLQVGESLLRRFFYYEGSLWVLSRISNYSLTTWDFAECEFIQVRNKDNYTDGQS